jgi:phosphoglycolate phosphatase-like HAD superfamily hydrolase
LDFTNDAGSRASAVPKLLLFDVDGTLIDTGGAGRRAMRRTFEDVFQVSPSSDAFDLPGRTDRLVIQEILSAAGRPSPDARECRAFAERYEEHLRHELQVAHHPRGVVKPGVVPLLESLAARADVLAGLLTGNLRRAAQLKLEHFGLWSLVSWGAFGDQALDRAELLPEALEAHLARGGAPLPASDVWVIGDTPQDVACARAHGARAVAVATGAYDAAALAHAGADHILADLSNTAAFLQLLDEPPEPYKKTGGILRMPPA